MLHIGILLLSHLVPLLIRPQIASGHVILLEGKGGEGGEGVRGGRGGEACWLAGSEDGERS